MGEPARVATGRGHAFSASPVLEHGLPAWRSRLLLLLMFAAFATLAGRAVWLQLGSSEFLQKQGAARYARTLALPATRGRILDRNGEVLALSLPARAVWAIPAEARGAAPAGGGCAQACPWRTSIDGCARLPAAPWPSRCSASMAAAPPRAG